MYKLAVFDIDGTLSVKKDEVPESAIKAIKELQEKGIHCIIATGRGRRAIENMARITGIKNYVALNGQYVYYEDEVTYSYRYPKDVTKKVVEICEKMDCYYGLISERGYYIPGVEELLKIHKSSILTSDIIIETLEDGEEINQIVVFCEKDQHSYFDELRDNYVLTTWHSGGFDMLVNSRSKAEGIKEIAKELNVDRRDIICFGDGENDIEMLKFAGMGVAMGNASEEVKGAADYITEEVDEDGIYKACRKLGIL